AAAPGLEELHAARRELLVGRDDVRARLTRTNAERDDGRVLQQQQRVASRSRATRLDEFALQLEPVGVVDAPQAANLDRAGRVMPGPVGGGRYGHGARCTTRRTVRAAP